MRHGRLVCLGPIVVAMAIAIGLVALAVRPAAAAPADISGSWTAEYSLACSGSLSQTGSEVTGSLECGSGIAIDLSGTFDSSTSDVSLTGDLGDLVVTISGNLSGDGRTIAGMWSAPPLVEEGAFFALREDPPTTQNIAGFWLVSVRNIFASHCTVDIQQDGSQVVADLACENGPAGTLDGTYDPDTGAVSLNGPFGSFPELEVRVNVSEDGESFTGIWRLVPDGPAGIMDGERLPGAGRGDVNCSDRVDVIDALLVLQFDAGLLGSLACRENADVNGGGISSIDAALILQRVAGLISGF